MEKCLWVKLSGLCLGLLEPACQDLALPVDRKEQSILGDTCSRKSTGLVFRCRHSADAQKAIFVCEHKA